MLRFKNKVQTKYRSRLHKKLIESVKKGYVTFPRGSGKNWLYEKLKEYQEEAPEEYFKKRYSNVWIDEAKKLKEANMDNRYYDAPEVVKKYLGIQIDKVQNGWIIKVGCAIFVETDWNKICKALKEYWDDPAKAEKKYYKK